MSEGNEKTYSLREVLEGLRKEKLGKKLQELKERGGYEDVDNWLIDQGLNNPFDHEELKPFKKDNYIRRKRRHFKKYFQHVKRNPEKLKNDKNEFEFTEEQKKCIELVLEAADEVDSPWELDDNEKLNELENKLEDKQFEKNREDLSIDQEKELAMEIAEIEYKIEKIKKKERYKSKKILKNVYEVLDDSINPDSNMAELVEKSDLISCITATRLKYHLDVVTRDFQERIDRLAEKFYEMEPLRAAESMESLESDITELSKSLEEIKKKMDSALKREEMSAELARKNPLAAGDDPEREDLLKLLEKLREVNENFLDC